MDYEKLLNMAAELGYQLMYSGAEIYRVEESARRLLHAYGLENPEVFAIPNCLIVSVATPEGHPVTRMRRVPSHGTDIELLERCNSLCRRLCAEAPPLDTAQAAIDALPEAIPRHSIRMMLLGYGVAPAFFAPLFGGGLPDTACSFFCGLAVGLCLLCGGKFIGANSFFRTAVCSAVAAFLSLTLVEAGLGTSVDVVTISTLMVLVPGVALTNAMREIMAGDTFSALSRTADAILTGTAIALGAAAGQALGGFF